MFDPVQERKQLREFTLRFLKATSFDASRPMGNVAMSDLNMIIAGIVAGMWDELRDEIPRRLEWIEHGLKGNEKFGESQSFHRSGLLKAKGICLWLLRDEPAVDIWSQAYDEHAVYFHESYAKHNKRAPSLALDNHIALACLAKRYDDGIAAYRKYVSDADPKPKSAKQPREIGQLICLATKQSGAISAETEGAAHRMLRGKLADEWLGRGHGLQAATWLKIVWDYLGCGEPANEILLLAYEDMPEVAKPADIA